MDRTNSANIIKSQYFKNKDQDPDENEKQEIVDIFSTDQMFNQQKTWRQNNEGSPEKLSHYTSSIIGDNNSQTQNPQQEGEKDSVKERDQIIVKQLIQQSSGQGQDLTETNQILTSKNKIKGLDSLKIMGQDSELPLSKIRDDLGFTMMAHSSKKREASIQNNQAILNIKLIAQIRKKINYFYRNFTSSGRKQYLSNMDVRLAIDDKCDMKLLDRNIFFVTRILHEIKYRLKRVDLHVNKYMPTFNPHSLTYYLLQRFFALFNAIFYLVFSITIIFHGPEFYESAWFPITLIAWIFESMFHLNSMIYLHNELVVDKLHILANYIRSRAPYDIISFVTMCILKDVSKDARIYFYIISFVKLVNLYRDITEIQKDLIMQVKNYYMVSLINLIFQIFIVGHVIACMWYLVGQIELEWLGYETTWYEQGLNTENSWWKLYLESMYWSLTLLTTGSNLCYSYFQMFFTTFIMIFTTIIFGYLLNVTGVIISQLDAQNESMRLDLNVINDYMRANKISKQLRARVNTDIENYYRNNMNKNVEDRQLILNRISPILQEQLRLEYCNQIIEKFPTFQKKFSKATLERLSQELDEIYFLPNQIIFEEGETDDISLMYIAQGSVELQQSNLDGSLQKTLLKLKKGQIFGAVNFFTGIAHDKFAVSTKFTKIIKISRDKFINIIRDDEKDYQVFCQIKDKLLVYENFDVIEQKCIFCQNSTHLEIECHLIHIQKDEIYKKLRFYENKIQQRQEWTRKQSYLKTYTTFSKVKHEVEYFREFHKSDLEELDYNQTHNKLQANTNTDITSEFDEEEEDDYFSQDNDQTHNYDKESLPSFSHKEIPLPQEILNNHKRNENLVDQNEIKFTRIESQLAPQDPIITKPHPHFHDEGTNLLTSVNYGNAEKIQRKGNRNLSMIRKEEQGQKRGSNFSKQSTIRTNQRTDVNDIVINFLEDQIEDRQLSSASPDKKSRNQKKVPTFLKPQDPNKKRSSIFAKYKNQEETINEIANLHSISSNNNSNNNPSLYQSQYNKGLRKSPTLSKNNENKVTIEDKIKPRSTLDYIKENLHAYMMHETIPVIQGYTEWDFDRQQDWKYYFPSGNSKNIFLKHLKFQKKKLKQSTKKKTFFVKE